MESAVPDRVSVSQVNQGAAQDDAATETETDGDGAAATSNEERRTPDDQAH